MNVRTPDPNPGWLSEEDLFEARGRLPMVYVEAVPVRLDPLGFVNEVGTLLQADADGNMIRSLVSGRRSLPGAEGAAVGHARHTRYADEEGSLAVGRVARKFPSTALLVRPPEAPPRRPPHPAGANAFICGRRASCWQARAQPW